MRVQRLQLALTGHQSPRAPFSSAYSTNSKEDNPPGHTEGASWIAFVCKDFD